MCSGMRVTFISSAFELPPQRLQFHLLWQDLVKTFCFILAKAHQLSRCRMFSSDICGKGSRRQMLVQEQSHLMQHTHEEHIHTCCSDTRTNFCRPCTYYINLMEKTMHDFVGNPYVSRQIQLTSSSFLKFHLALMRRAFSPNLDRGTTFLTLIRYLSQAHSCSSVQALSWGAAAPQHHDL